MNIGSIFNFNIKADKQKKTEEKGLLPKGAGRNLAPLSKDTVSFQIKTPPKYPVKSFSAIGAGIIPFFAKDSIAANKALEEFENNEINHIELQNKLVNAGVQPDCMPNVFQKITSILPDFMPKKDEVETGALYRFTGKEEFDKLVEGKEVEARLAYNGNCFDVTSNPTLNHNDFARIKFKYDKDNENVNLHDDMHDYYRLNKTSYTLDDVEEIDRILPNGYIAVYKAK